MNISLTPKLEEYVREKVASGLYNNASEVMREALRLLFQRERGQIGQSASPPLEKEHALAKLAALEKPLRKRGLASLALFGSVMRNEARPDSDVDVLIQVAPGTRFSMVDLVSLKHFLEERLGREVDVVTREGLDPSIRDRVLREAEKVF